MDATAETQQSRASKEERTGYLIRWCLTNPLATIEEARTAVKEQFGGMAVGTKLIADTLREARRARVEGSAPSPGPAAAMPPAPRRSLQEQVQVWAREMREYRVRLVEIREDGSVHLELMLH